MQHLTLYKGISPPPVSVYSGFYIPVPASPDCLIVHILFPHESIHLFFKGEGLRRVKRVHLLDPPVQCTDGAGKNRMLKLYRDLSEVLRCGFYGICRITFSQGGVITQVPLIFFPLCIKEK
jgi:hypothetical protein